MWFRFGQRGARILVIEDEQVLIGKSVVLGNVNQTIAITQDAFEGPLGFGQELNPDSADILSLYDFQQY